MSKKLVVGFSDGGNLFSKLIKLVTKSDVSHVFILFDIYEQAVIFQASGLVVNYESYEHFLKHEKIVEMYSMEVTAEQWEQARRDQISKLGVPYSVSNIIGLVWVLLCRLFGKNVKNPFSTGDHAYICVDLAAEQLGVDWDGTMTPADMRAWCKQNPNLVRDDRAEPNPK